MVFFRAAHRRLGGEIEFARIETGHARQATAEGVEPQHLRLHLAHALRERVQVRDRLAPRLIDGGALRGELALLGADHRDLIGLLGNHALQLMGHNTDQRRQEYTQHQHQQQHLACGQGDVVALPVTTAWHQDDIHSCDLRDRLKRQARYG